MNGAIVIMAVFGMALQWLTEQTALGHSDKFWLLVHLPPCLSLTVTVPIIKWLECLCTYSHSHSHQHSALCLLVVMITLNEIKTSRFVLMLILCHYGCHSAS